MGLESSGKSLLVAHMIAETQKKGGIAVLIDSEQAISKEFLTALGVDLKKLIYIQTSVIETIFESIQNIIETIRKKSNDVLVGIFVDSIMGASDKTEMESTFDKSGYATQKSIIISKAMRKINAMIGNQRVALVFTNQLRTKVGGFIVGDPYQTSGGKAIPFHSSLRVRLKHIGRLKRGSDVIGIKVKSEAIKSRLGPAYRQVEFDIYYSHGMDQYTTWFEHCKKYKLIVPATEESENEKGKKTSKKVKGLWSIDSMPEIKFEQTELKSVLKDEKIKSYLYDRLAEEIIFKYKPADDEFDVEGVEVDVGDDDIETED